ncbi:MAG: bifunctional hydroxymethylpyrimidine kinase/phosphomethylpyrimidine kinase, partial [Betaproteobacteria bacterium]|nr:bifunctional hydroxymethylpyrimidine kinase/phosphomethylpyrimidine kinase [Betaproteobacteria bacterium]
EDEDLDLARCAKRLLAAGCEYVLITGTHENTVQVVNRLYGEQGEIRNDAWQRLPGSYHGSGCTLASALAATLANGLPVEEAARDAQEYTWQTLKAGFRPGMGQFVPDRLFWARETDEDATADDTAGDTEGATRVDATDAAGTGAVADNAGGGLPPARATAH